MSRLLPRAYLLFHRATHRLGVPFTATGSGLWLGLLDGDALAAVDEAMYAGGGYLGDEHNLRGLFPWEETALDEWFAGRRRLLLVGAGGGRELVALAARGLSVDAYECNPALVAAGNDLLERRGVDARIALLPRDEAPGGGGPYDGGLVGWSAYMLMPGRERRIRFLRGMHDRLQPGAPLLLSFWTRMEGAPRPPRVVRVANTVRRMLGRPRVDLGDDLAPNYLHSFTEAEVRAEMTEGGFQMMRFVPHGPGGRDSGWAVGHAV